MTISISIIASDLTYNTVGRSYMIGKCLESEFDIEILGPKFVNDDIWEPVRGEFDYKEYSGGYFPKYIGTMAKMVADLDSDLIYVVTPRIQNLVPGLVASKIKNSPLIVDIVDWESSFISEFSNPILHSFQIWDPNAMAYRILAEKITRYADEKTVVSSFLEEKFGGVRLPQARDTEKMDPDKYDSSDLRKKFGLAPEDKIILFLGTPRKHKGLIQLVKAVNRAEVENKKLLIVGASESDLLDQVREVDEGNVDIYGKQPFQEIPKFHAVADVVAVPQQPSLPAKAQIPAKIIDALAMGNPVISTNLSDIPEVVDGAGVIVPPGDIKQLKKAIENLLLDDDKRKLMGKVGRERCINKYSYDAASDILKPLIEDLIGEYESNTI